MSADDKSSPNLTPEMARLYRNYLVTCRRLGVELVTRERAVGLMQEWNEVLSGRREPTQH
jgi:hypothetical protein